ncbi:MAG: hypothetical protein ACK55Z_06635, partial [bacterium]
GPGHPGIGNSESLELSPVNTVFGNDLKSLAIYSFRGLTGSGFLLPLLSGGEVDARALLRVCTPLYTKLLLLISVVQSYDPSGCNE